MAFGILKHKSSLFYCDYVHLSSLTDNLSDYREKA